MSIKESALTAITSIAQSDFIRAVTSAGASRRITLANLAKAIVESYTGSSLAGSSQSVKSAIDSLNSNMPIRVQTVSVSDIAVPANGGKNGEVLIPAVTGYKPIGLIGWESSAWEVAPSKMTTIVGGAKVWYSLANASTSSKTVTFTMTVLYIPSSRATA